MSFVLKTSIGVLVLSLFVPEAVKAVRDNGTNNDFPNLQDNLDARAHPKQFKEMRSKVNTNVSTSVLDPIGELRRRKRQASNCFAVINEANIDHPGSGRNQFIEILQICSGPLEQGFKPSLSGYKLVILQGSPVQIIFVLDLSELRMTKVDDMGYVFVVGGADVNLNWKFDFSDSRAQNVYSGSSIPAGDESPFGILLMYARDRRDIKNVKLTKRDANGNYVPRIIDFNFNVMRLYTLDMLVYGRKVHTNRCSIFEKIMQREDFLNNADRITYEGDQYLLRDFDDPNNGDDFSLNRCTSETTPFVPRRFRLGRPSPGSTNDCSGATFFIETHLKNLVLQPASNNDEQPIETCEPDTAGVPAEKYRDLSAEQYHQLQKNEMGRAGEDCAPENLRAVSNAMDKVQLVSNNNAIESLGQEPSSRLIDEHHFNSELIEICQIDFPSDSTILHEDSVQRWLDMVLSGGQCRYSCFYCKQYFALGFKADQRRKTQICTPDGYHSPNPTRNKDNLLNHMKSNVHHEAVNLVTKLSLAASEAQLVAIYDEAKEKERADLKATINHVILNYAERISGVSFNKHPVFVTTATLMGASMGVHHFHPTASEQMNKVMLLSFHETLLKFLIQENNEFSLIADGSTDNTNVPYLVVYLQSLEDGYPMTYFYRLIELPNGESSEALFNALKEKVLEDEKVVPGFELYFKSKLAALATDGHPAMMGSQSSLHTHIRDYVGRYIPLVWCFNHRLDLGIKKGLVNNNDKDFWYFKYFEQTINKFYVFYMRYGSKTWQHLTEVAESLGLHVSRIRYFFSVRWSSSHYEAIKSIQSNWRALMTDLIAIGQDDSEFNQKSRDKAQDLHALLEDKTFTFMLNEYSDFLYLFKQVSEAFQASEGLLVAKAGLVQEVIDAMTQLKIRPGKHVTSFLELCQSDRCALGQCTLETFFMSPYVTFGGTHLRDNPSTANFYFPNLRPKLYDALIEGISSYFNLPLLKSLQIFDPMKFGHDTSTSQGHSQPSNAYCTSAQTTAEDWNSICKFFFDSNTVSKKKASDAENERRRNDKSRLDSCTNSLGDWRTLEAAIVAKEDLRSNFHETPAAFWFLALRCSDLPWTPTLRKILNHVLVTPFGSSDCERGFSILNLVKTKTTNKLSPNTVENILRVRINGPSDIHELKVERYAREFLKIYIRPDDLTFKGGRKKNPLNEKAFRKSSRLF